jgi:hypothetical protein
MEQLPPELNLNFVDENADEYVCTDEPDLDVNDIIETTEHLVVEKEPIKHEVIFDDNVIEIEPKQPTTNNEPDEFLTHRDEDIDIEPEKPKKKEKPIRLNKNGKPRKQRVYTEEQKQKMRERMKYAREQSGKNKKQKEEQKQKEKKYKELMEKKKELDMEETEQRIKNKNKPKEPPKPIQAQISKEDLKQAQLEAIIQYETLRKARKAKKREQERIKQYNEDVKTNLKKELGWRDVAGEYADCF